MRNVQEAFTVLLDRALPNLTLEELDLLAEADDEAEERARRLSVVMEGVACLVDTDAQHRGSNQAGNFQDGDSVFELLCKFAGDVSVIASLIHISGEAKCEAGKRRGFKP